MRDNRTLKQLLVNADDFGLCRGVTDGILEGHQQGIVTSTSIMATGDAFAYAASQLPSNPKLNVGVHLTLVEEGPACDPAQIPTLVQPDGRLPKNYSALLLGVVLGRVRLRDIERELRAQIEKCVAAGLQPTHLDSHQHVHALPTLFKLVVRLAQEYKIRGIRIPRDSTRWRGSRSGSFLQTAPKTGLCWLARYDGRALPQGLVACDQMVGLFDSGSLTEDCLLQIIELLPEGTTELVSHPGRTDAETAKYSHWKYNWVTELKALTSTRVREALVARNVQLVSYRGLASQLRQ